MLKEMRRGAKSTVLKLTLFGLLLLAMAGLALMDVQGMFRNGMANSVIAKYGSQKMTTVEFDRLVQNTLRNQQMKQSDAYRAGLPQKLLGQEIDGRLFSMAADDLGLQIDDVMAAKQVKAMLAPLVAKGATEKEALQRMLQVYGITEAHLVEIVKSQIASQQLLETVVAGAHAPQEMATAMLRYRHEWRRGEYFLLNASELGSDKKPSEEELKAYYDTIAAEYALPEYRTLSVIVLDKNILGDEAKVSEAQVKEFYDDNITDYKSIEVRDISQVVAEDEETAKQVYAAAEKTKDLKKAAASAAKGKANYIKTGAFTEKDMPVELAPSAFAGAAGKVLPPVKSPLGWHILYVEKVTPSVTKPFASVKADIAKEMAQDKLSEALYTRANKIDDDIGSGKTLAEVAKENHIQEIVLDKIDVHGIGQNGKKPDIKLPLMDKLVDTGFKLKKSGASPLIETPDGAFMIVGVKEIIPSEQQPFEKMRAAVLERWNTDQRVKSLSEKAAKIMERLKQGETFDKIAAEYKKTVQSTELVQRGTPAVKARMQDNMMSALFSLDKPGMATTVSGDNSVIIIRLAERKIQPDTFAKKENDEALAVLNRALEQSLLAQYRMNLVDKYDVSINEKLLNEMYAPKESNGTAEEE